VYRGKVEGEDPTSKTENRRFVAWRFVHQPAEEVILVGQLREEITIDLVENLLACWDSHCHIRPFVDDAPLEEAAIASHLA